ncbi:MAG: hypothetical protein V4857_04115 [Pseudomonadota bacterium]
MSRFLLYQTALFEFCDSLIREDDVGFCYLIFSTAISEAYQAPIPAYCLLSRQPQSRRAAPALPLRDLPVFTPKNQ